jgi:hypothetical protein
MGKARSTRDWPERGGYPRHRAIEVEREGVWLLPATEESPDHAAKRIARQ